MGVARRVLMAGVLGAVVGLVPGIASAAADTGPGFLQTCSRAPGVIDNSDPCIQAVLDAIDNARASEGLGPMVLPAQYATLPADAQLLVILDRERIDRGLPPFSGTTSELDAGAQQGADRVADPTVSAPSYAAGRWEGTSTQASALSQALGADYYWMYGDGWNGSRDATFNIDCSSADAPGCWGHRRALLFSFDAGLTLSLGGAVSPDAFQRYPSWATLTMGTTGQPPAYTVRWSDFATSTAAAASSPPTECGSTDAPSGRVGRVAGAGRDATAILASTAAYPAAGSAGAVVLASDANFPDALTGGPLAAAKHGPLLLAPPSGLTEAVRNEITRVLDPGGTVYVLGGSLALQSTIDDGLRAGGYSVQRIAGQDRYETAVAVANARGGPASVIEVTGDGFADALAAAPAATAIDAALLLTDGSHQAGATARYVATHSGQRFAVGGPAGAADPSATPVVGADRFATALEATRTFVTKPAALAFATGAGFADALAGGSMAAGAGGGLLLVPSCGALPADISSYLSSVGSGLDAAWLLGGSTAVGDNILGQLDRAIG